MHWHFTLSFSPPGFHSPSSSLHLSVCTHWFVHWFLIISASPLSPSICCLCPTLSLWTHWFLPWRTQALPHCWDTGRWPSPGSLSLTSALWPQSSSDLQTLSPAGVDRVGERGKYRRQGCIVLVHKRAAVSAGFWPDTGLYLRNEVCGHSLDKPYYKDTKNSMIVELKYCTCAPLTNVSQHSKLLL